MDAGANDNGDGIKRVPTSSSSGSTPSATTTMVRSYLAKAHSIATEFLAELEDFDEDSPGGARGHHRMTLYGDVDAENSFQKNKYVPRHLRHAGRLQPARLFAFRVVRSHCFDVCTGAVIVINACCIGLEQLINPERVRVGREVEIVENIFLTIYWCELVLRFFAIGPRCIRDNWVKFDTFLVITGSLATFLSNVEALSKLLVLRAARLLRIARTVRLLIKFHELWMLVKGMSGSVNTMFYTAALLMATLYVFSCMGVELITRHPFNIGDQTDHEFQEHVELYFPDLPRTMLTLVQFVTGDSMSHIYVPFIKADPTLGIYFFGLILLISIVMMNLVTAVIVNSALEEASKDKEMLKVQGERERADLIKEMSDLFERLDVDGSGTVSIDELRAISGEDRAVLTRACMADDLIKIFKAIDIEGDGFLSIDEFCNGVYKMTVAQKPMEMQRMERQLEGLYTMMHGSIALQRDVCKCISRLSGDSDVVLDNMSKAIHNANSLLKRQYTQFTHVPSYTFSEGINKTVSKGSIVKGPSTTFSRGATPGSSAETSDGFTWAQQLAEILRTETRTTNMSIDTLRSELADWGLVAAQPPKSTAESSAIPASQSKLVSHSKAGESVVMEGECSCLRAVSSTIVEKPSAVTLRVPRFASDTAVPRATSDPQIGASSSVILAVTPNPDSVLDTPSGAKHLADAIRMDARMTKMSIDQLCGELLDFRTMLDSGDSHQAVNFAVETLPGA